MSEVSKSSIVVYFCGGTALNISRALSAAIAKYDTTGAGNLKMVFVDTATSNLPNGVKAEDIFLIKTDNGRQGSGKIRSENSDNIIKESLAVLQKNEPGDLNIVVSSLGGGKHAAYLAA